MLKNLLKQSRYILQFQSQIFQNNQTFIYFSTKLSKTFERVKEFKKMEGDIKIRSNPIVTKLDTPEFKSIFTKELYDLIDLFKRYNYEIRVAGGAVRDILMNIKPKDIDFATTATPEQMKEMFNRENIRMINMKGEKHGTITPRINDKENFEITTLRIDVLTDGRHAEVQFTTDWQLDANRRDLTINSMFLGFDGSVYDYFYGYEDLHKRRVLFVGSPDRRIKEDYLRILRYFRFYGRIAEEPDKHDENTIKAITNNINGLQKISGERIWSELKKILEGNFVHDLTILMLKCGISKYIGLPNECNITEFENVYKNQENLNNEKLHSISFMTALLNNVDDAIKMHERLKLSAFERDLAVFIAQNREQLRNVNDIMIYKKLLVQPNIKREYVEELLRYYGRKQLLDELKKWKIPHFQINGNMLKDKGCPSGKVIGIVMSKLKTIWANENFVTSVDDLLTIHLPKILEEIKTEHSNKKLKLSK